jgi:type VI secretion system Hcp family effector
MRGSTVTGFRACRRSPAGKQTLPLKRGIGIRRAPDGLPAESVGIFEEGDFMSGQRSRLVRLSLSIAFVIAGWSSSADAALDTYLIASGAKQGAIPGDVTAKGFENSIEVNEAHHLIQNSSGVSTTHEPFIFTKQVDRASTKLFRALDTVESLSMEFKFTRPSASGTVEIYYNIRLTNARIVAIEPITPSNLDPASVSLPSQERVRVVYDQISIRYMPTGDEVILSGRP